MKRRALLALSGATLTGMAGCAGVGESESASRYNIRVQNSAQQSQQIRVRVNSEGDTELYDERFSLDAQKAMDGSDTFSGTPSRITVSVDGTTAFTTDWPTRETELRNGSVMHQEESGCKAETRGSVSGMTIYVEQPDFITLQPTCKNSQRGC